MRKSIKSMIPGRATGREGFTLIELMISLVVLAFGILGFLFLQGRAVQGRVFAREMSRATFVAQSNMEELLSMDFDHTLLSPGAHPTAGEGGTDALGTGTLVLTEPLGNFNYYTNWVVRTSSPKVKSIQITVTWLNKDKNPNDPNDPNPGTPLKSLILTTAKSK